MILLSKIYCFLKISFTISPSVSIQTKLQGGDDPMGTYMILRSDANWEQYSNNNLKLYFHH